MIFEAYSLELGTIAELLSLIWAVFEVWTS